MKFVAAVYGACRNFFSSLLHLFFFVDAHSCPLFGNYILEMTSVYLIVCLLTTLISITFIFMFGYA